MISLAAMRGSRVAVFFSSRRGCAGSKQHDDQEEAAPMPSCPALHPVYIFPFMPQAITPVSFACILIGVLLNASAQLLLKAGVIAGLVCYAASLMVWIMGLSRVDVSIAYPMLSLGYVVNALLAALFFGEALTLQRSAGILIILLGVYVLARSGG